MIPFSCKPWLSVALLGAVAACLLSAGAWLYVRQANGTILAEAGQGAVESARVFASATSGWILSEVDHRHLLNRVLEVMLGSGTVFVQVSHFGAPVINARAVGWEYYTLPEGPSADGEVRLHAVGGQMVLDTLVSFPDTDLAIGSVRVGTQAEGLPARFGSVRLGAALGAASAWVLLCAIATAVRWRGRAQTLLEVAEPEAASLAERQGSPLALDSRSKRVSYHNREVLLSPKPFLLLELLAQDHGRVFSDNEIIQHVWAGSTYINSNDVRQCVYRLRCRLNAIERGLGDCIINVKGFGYRFDVGRLS